jgi:hypothetical protein
MVCGVLWHYYGGWGADSTRHIVDGSPQSTHKDALAAALCGNPPVLVLQKKCTHKALHSPQLSSTDMYLL